MDDNVDPKAEKAALIAALRQHLTVDRNFGIEVIARGPALPERVTQSRAQMTLPPVLNSSAIPAPPSSLMALRDETMPRVAVALPAPNVPAQDSLLRIITEIATCKACGLCASRINTVPGEGSASPDILFVGEGPGAEEDAHGRPFIGRSGQLLTTMIEAMGLTREQVFITSVVKCRPPSNRLPEFGEIAACVNFLHRQIAMLKPKVICTLGNTPLRTLTGDLKAGVTSLRGQRLDYRGIPLIPTFHPAYLLRNPPAKKPCWEDLKVVLAVLGRTPPPRPAAPTRSTE